jgi:hypothetical protein
MVMREEEEVFAAHIDAQMLLLLVYCAWPAPCSAVEVYSSAPHVNHSFGALSENELF